MAWCPAPCALDLRHGERYQTGVISHGYSENKKDDRAARGIGHRRNRDQGGRGKPAHCAGAPGLSAALRPCAPAAAAEGPLRAGAGEHIVTAPMVGTFYSGPSPGAKNFVEIGDEVELGQVMCI